MQDHDRVAWLLTQAGAELAAGHERAGEELISSQIPHAARVRTRRSANAGDKLNVWMADGFRCRYTGDLLVFPGYLTLLSAVWPETFPGHPNWKTDAAHDAYWTHSASLEHLDPVASGGAETDDNWITTSMARNQVRSRYPLQSLGWTVQARARRDDWDGGLGQFKRLIANRPELLSHAAWGRYLERWHRAVEAFSPGR